MKVKARLSNPSPKTQAVKGEMCGGFRIGHVSSGTLSHTGKLYLLTYVILSLFFLFYLNITFLRLIARGSGRGAHFSGRTVQRGRGFFNHGRGQTSGMGFPHNRGLEDPFRGRQSYGRGYQIIF